MWGGWVELVVWGVVYTMVVGVGLLGLSYVLVWGVLEVSLMLSLTYFVWMNSRVGGVFYYYVVQTLSSLMMIMGAMVGEGLMVLVSFVVKMGLFPVYVWMVGVVWGMEMGGSILLVLWAQKLVPLLLLFEWGWVIEWGSGLLWSVVCSGVIVGSISMVAGVSIKWLLVMSSLIHSSWLVVIMMGSCGGLLFYFLVYGLLLMVVLANSSEHLGAVSGLVVLSSVPPLVGFMLKFYSLSLVIEKVVLFVVAGLAVVVATVVGYFANLVGMFMLSSVSCNWTKSEVVGSVGLLLLITMVSSVFYF